MSQLMVHSGGNAISYHNISRYFDNTGFKTIIEGGWIGTNHNQSKILENIIRNILENGRAAVLAIKKNISRKVQFEQEDPVIGNYNLEDLPF